MKFISLKQGDVAINVSCDSCTAVYVHAAIDLKGQEWSGFCCSVIPTGFATLRGSAVAGVYRGTGNEPTSKAG